MPYTSQSLGHYIQHLAMEHSNQCAITYYHRFRIQSYTYSDLYNLTLKSASFFLEKGLKKGDKILIYGENCPEWVVMLFTCAMTGFVLVPIDRKSPVDFAKKILEQTETKWVITDQLFPQRKGVKQLRLDSLFSHISSSEPSRLEKANLMISGDDVLEILYTSGTTAEPKGVVIHHRNMVLNIWAVRQRLIYEKSYRFLSMLPLSHIFEQNVGCLSIFRFGGHIVYTNQVRFSRILEILREEKISHLIAIPAILKNFQTKILEQVSVNKQTKFFNMLLKICGTLPIPFRRMLTYPIRKKLGNHLKAFICGGAPLNIKTETFWEDLGILVVTGYGLTETCAMSSGNTFHHRKKGSVGKPMPKQSIMLGPQNEILLGGENVISSYYKSPELTKQSFYNGWYRSGDVGRFDEDGNLYIVGRLKEMILTENGLNIFPSDIEDVLHLFPEVKECVVFEDPDAHGKLLAAIIPAFPNLENKLHQIRTTANQSLAPHQQINLLFLWKESSFPKTTSLKIKRKELPKLYRQNALTRTSDLSSKSPLIQILSRITKIPTKDIQPNSKLSTDLGLDSLNLVELIIQLESQYHTQIDEGKIEPNTDISQLEKLIAISKNLPPPPSLPALYHKWPIRFLGRCLYSVIQHFFINRKIKVNIKEEIPSISTDKPTIFIANHTSHLDTFAILATLPSYFKKRLVIAAAADYFFGKTKKRNLIMNPLVLPIIPFHREKYFSENLKNIGESFRRGKHLLIFPEGTRSRTGKLGSFKPGIAMIAKEMNAQVIPIYIQGAYELWPASQTKPTKGTISVRYGTPISFSERDSLETITSFLQTKIMSLSRASV